MLDRSLLTPAEQQMLERCEAAEKQWRTAIGAWMPDSDFISHARTDLPSCLAEIARLRALVKDAYEQGYMTFPNLAWSKSDAKRLLFPKEQPQG